MKLFCKFVVYLKVLKQFIQATLRDDLVLLLKTL